METTTETNPANRELTATEIKIAIAQIEDRLMRLAKAQAELTEFCGDGECAEYNRMMTGIPEDQCNDENEKIINEKTRNLRAKYEIPDAVHLFYEGMESAFLPEVAKRCKPHLSAWVKGKLTSDQCEDIYFFFEEFEQADWGWIMLECPLGYYYPQFNIDQKSILLEMISIGTRSRSKKNKLPPLIVF